MQHHYGFQSVADQFSDAPVRRLADYAPQFQKIWSACLILRFCSSGNLEMNRPGVAGPAPCLRGEGQDGGEQFAERVEDFLHCGLRRAPARRIQGVAIHPVFGDVDVKTAQIDGAKLIERVINLVELESPVSESTITDYLTETLQNPAIDQCAFRLFFLLPLRSYKFPAEYAAC